MDSLLEPIGTPSCSGRLLSETYLRTKTGFESEPELFYAAAAAAAAATAQIDAIFSGTCEPKCEK